MTIANFYFWNIGSDYEKSLQGLYTSLLYQIFSQCPGFISKVWPAHWAQANSGPWLASKVIEVTEKDIIQAFSRVIDSQDVLESHCFAFFIDGLDEFQSTVQDDHRDLVRLLCRWAASPSGNIKICVSSREYPVFMDGFTPNLRIRFHDLTRRDMDTYIRDKLMHASAEESFENLVSLIMSKANGVFLWVALVVKSLREGLENGMSCSDLTHEVDVLPEQLESLYKHILMSLGRSARRRAYQTFSMVMELKKHGDYRMSLLAYSFLEEYEAGKNFFMNEGNDFPMDSLTGERGKIRAESTSRKLAGWCKGIVELYRVHLSTAESPVVAWEDWSMELEFVHRSVLDFLESDEVRQDTQQNLKHFDHVDAVLNLIPSEVLFESRISTYNTFRSGVTAAVLSSISGRDDIAQESFTHLRRISKLLGAVKKEEPMLSNTELLVTNRVKDGRFFVVNLAKSIGDAVETSHAIEDTSSNSTSVSEERSHRHHILDPLVMMTWLGFSKYPLWYIATHSAHEVQLETVSMLACCCAVGNLRLEAEDYEQDLLVLEALFERGWLTPNTITTCRPFMYEQVWAPLPAKMCRLTLWHHLLLAFLEIQYVPGRDDRPVFKHEWHNRKLQHEGKVFRLFLRFKADIDFSYAICVNEETTTLRRDFLFNLGKQGSVKFTTLHPDDIDEHIRDRHRPWEESEIGLPSENGTPAKREFSLREIIQRSTFDNKDELLQILDTQSKSNADRQPNTSTMATSPGRETKHILQDILPEDGKDDENKSSWGFSLQPLTNHKIHHWLEDAVRMVMKLWTREYIRYGVAFLAGKFSVIRP